MNLDNVAGNASYAFLRDPYAVIATRLVVRVHSVGVTDGNRCASAPRRLDRAPQCGHSCFLSRKAVVVNDQSAPHVEGGEEQTGCEDTQHRSLWKVSCRVHIFRSMASSTGLFVALCASGTPGAQMASLASIDRPTPQVTFQSSNGYGGNT